MASMAGLEAYGPFANSGTPTKAPQKSNNSNNSNSNTETRERVLNNIEESKMAREVSNYKDFAEFEKKLNESNKNTFYIPKNRNGNPIPLNKQRVNGQDIPVPDPAANGRPYTVLGGRISSKTGVIYRQSATFPETTWPLANGKTVPWSEVHWYNHGRGDHGDIHQHIFEFNGSDWLRGGPADIK